MIKKIIKIFFILFVSITFVGIYIQLTDLTITLPTKQVIQVRQSNGAFVEYYKNGKIYSEEFYKDGFRYGNWRFYYENGALKKELNYNHGLLKGEQHYYSTQGKLIYTEIYIDGEIDEYIIKSDSLYNYEVNLLQHGEDLFKKECKTCHMNKKDEIIYPYYLEKTHEEDLSIDSLFYDYFNSIHSDSLNIPKIDSSIAYDVLAVIRYIDKQYQTAKKTPKKAIRLRKIRLNKKTPQL
jgi:hypothetical protein